MRGSSYSILTIELEKILMIKIIISYTNSLSLKYISLYAPS